MKKWILHILLFTGIFGMLATSCSQEADDPTQDSRMAQVVFTIALDNSSAGSRGSWGDVNQPIGTAYENYIDPQLFHVQIATSNSTYTVRNIVTQKISDNAYQFRGEVSIDTTSGSAKIMVYANMDTDTDGNLVTTFNQTATYIPMFGVKTITLPLNPGELNDFTADPIFLLRAMAKVEVKLSDETAASYNLAGVTLNTYNKKGNCLPGGLDEETVEETKDLCYPDNDSENSDDPSCFNPYIDIDKGTNLEFTVTDNVCIVYLPEVVNGTGDAELKMTLALTDKSGNSVALSNSNLYFHDYSVETKPKFNIVRNHWYQYTVTVNDAKEVTPTLYYQVWPWEDIDNGTLTFGDENGATLIPDNSNQ